MKQQLETKLDKLIAAQKARTVFGRLKLFSVLKRARRTVNRDDYIALENKVMEAIKASGADALIKKLKLDEGVKGDLLKAENAGQMQIIALQLAFNEAMDVADKALDKAVEPTGKAYEEAKEVAFKTFKAKAKTVGVDFSKMSVEELRIFFEHTRRKNKGR